MQSTSSINESAVASLLLLILGLRQAIFRAREEESEPEEDEEGQAQDGQVGGRHVSSGEFLAFIFGDVDWNDPL